MCIRDRCREEELPWDLDNACAIVVRERETRWYRVAGYLALGVLTTLAEQGISLRAELPPHQGELTLAEYVEMCIRDRCGGWPRYAAGRPRTARPRAASAAGRRAHRPQTGRPAPSRTARL